MSNRPRGPADDLADAAAMVLEGAATVEDAAEHFAVSTGQVRHRVELVRAGQIERDAQERGSAIVSRAELPSSDTLSTSASERTDGKGRLTATDGAVTTIIVGLMIAGSIAY